MPSNPGQAFFDVRAVAELAHAHGLPLIVDSTVATPALLRPLMHGADIVVQSVTKTLTSSGFAIAGAVIARKGLTCRVGPDEMKADFAMYLKTLPNRDYGPNLSPMNAILSLNDIRTLRSKVDLFSRNTHAGRRASGAAPAVEQVDYLGLPSHPLHELASRYLFLVDAEHDAQYGKPVNRYGHLMSFRVKGGAKRRAAHVRRAAAHLARHRSRAGQVGRHDPGDLHAPAAGRGSAGHGGHPAQPGAAVRRRRAPRRHHRRPGPGAGGVRRRGDGERAGVLLGGRRLARAPAGEVGIRYYSTNHRAPEVDLAQALLQGQAGDKGLFMPRPIPRMPRELLPRARTLAYPELAAAVLALYAEGVFSPRRAATRSARTPTTSTCRWSAWTAAGT